MRVAAAVFLFLALVVSSCTNSSHSRFAADPNVIVESRGVWFTKNEILENRESIEARLDRLAAAHFNTIYIVTQLRGYVVYPGSAILPQWQELADIHPDLLAWLIPEIHERGMRAEAWTEYGLYAYHTMDATRDPSRGVILDAHPELTALDRDGGMFLHNDAWGDFYSFCPSNDLTHEMLGDLYAEMLERYPFDGLHLDRIRFASGDYCYCDHCKAAFLDDTGVDMASIQPESKDAERLVKWRKQQTARFVERMADIIDERFPGRSLTSAVVPPEMIDEKGQDWPLWVEKGWVDAVSPMLYRANIIGDVAFIQDRLGVHAPIFYGLGAEPAEPIFLQQIRDLRRVHAPGFTIWYATPVDPWLERLATEFFSQPAVSPLGWPASGSGLLDSDTPMLQNTP